MHYHSKWFPYKLNLTGNFYSRLNVLQAAQLYSFHQGAIDCQWFPTLALILLITIQMFACALSIYGLWQRWAQERRIKVLNLFFNTVYSKRSNHILVSLHQLLAHCNLVQILTHIQLYYSHLRSLKKIQCPCVSTKYVPCDWTLSQETRHFSASNDNESSHPGQREQIWTKNSLF